MISFTAPRISIQYSSKQQHLPGLASPTCQELHADFIRVLYGRSDTDTAAYRLRTTHWNRNVMIIKHVINVKYKVYCRTVWECISIKMTHHTKRKIITLCFITYNRDQRFWPLILCFIHSGTCLFFFTNFYEIAKRSHREFMGSNHIMKPMKCNEPLYFPEHSWNVCNLEFTKKNNLVLWCWFLLLSCYFTRWFYFSEISITRDQFRWKN